tara:strand:+ start:134 stop:589 length:456 start_codon:yes stop_codon:yes gene_type:complete
MKDFNFKPGTHKQILYDYLLLGKSITTRDAMIDLGLGDLQGTIRDLKKAGVTIETHDQKVSTRYYKADGSPKYAYVRSYRLETTFDRNIHTSTFRTAEEQAEWDNFSDEVPDELPRDMERRHSEVASGSCSYLGIDKGIVSVLQDRLDRSK